ncbi:Ubiquitin-protein ligase E3A [Giardia muris]|uniref:HECT-type E3 ubiquitin transferase n=1 Tax=Giardia muris TaxID=5742 RepID=A0A4Z1SWQ4_GIAMU|nr:Ubiquitin-protein ligase E3A [Giardia muris]|eukprot:TNJ29990.1 Ubiquitin-protein ligase E3A [Giardia muris]
MNSQMALLRAIVSMQLLWGCGQVACKNDYCATGNGWDKSKARLTPEEVVMRADDVVHSIGAKALCMISIHRLLFMWYDGLSTQTNESSRTAEPLRWVRRPDKPTDRVLSRLKGELDEDVARTKQGFETIISLQLMAVAIEATLETLSGLLHFILDGFQTLGEAYRGFYCFIDVITALETLDRSLVLKSLYEGLKSLSMRISIDPSPINSDLHVTLFVVLFFAPERFFNLDLETFEYLVTCFTHVSRRPALRTRFIVKMRLLLNSLETHQAIDHMEAIVRLCNRLISKYLSHCLTNRDDIALSIKGAFFHFLDQNTYERIVSDHHICHPLFWRVGEQTPFLYYHKSLSLVDVMSIGGKLRALCEGYELFYLINKLTAQKYPKLLLTCPTEEESLNTSSILRGFDLICPESSLPIPLDDDASYNLEHVLQGESDDLIATPVDFVASPFAIDIERVMELSAYIQYVPDAFFKLSHLCQQQYLWEQDAQLYFTVFDLFSKHMPRCIPYSFSSITPQMKILLDDIPTNPLFNLGINIDDLDHLLDYEVSRTIQYFTGSTGTPIRIEVTEPSFPSTRLQERDRIRDRIANAIIYAPKDSPRTTIDSMPFSFTFYSFVLSADVKQVILRYENGYLLRKHRLDPQWVIEFDRETIVSNFMQTVLTFANNNLDGPWIAPVHFLFLRRLIVVKYRGEEGVDMGALRRELFQIILPEFLSTHNELFHGCNEDVAYINVQAIRTIEPSRCARYPGPCVADFTDDERSYILGLRNTMHQLGLILGMALINGLRIPLKFPPVFYKLLLGLPFSQLTLNDLSGVDPVLASTLSNMREYLTAHSEGIPDCTFETLSQVCAELVAEELGDRDLETLTPIHDFLNQNEFPASSILSELKHAEIPNMRTLDDLAGVGVTSKTFLLFLRLKIISAIYHRRSFEYLRDGFMYAAKSRALALFTPEDLEFCLHGPDDVDFAVLEQHATYEFPYTRDSDPIKWFWDVVTKEFSPTQKTRLLVFITGSSRAPIGGFSCLVIKIMPNGEGDARLPTSHACFNVLCLPKYDTKDGLRRQLTYAIENCVGFGLA